MRSQNREAGFSVTELAVVVLLIGVVAAFAVPGIAGAMRSYRLSSATRQVSDTIARAKMLAVSQNRRAGIGVDVTGRRLGVVFYNDDLTINRVEYRDLPDDVNFQRPPNVSANPTGVTGSEAVSFDDRSGVLTLDFGTRGMPMMAAFGDVESIFIGNGEDYKSITINTVGGVQTYSLDNGDWISGRE